MPVIFMGMIFMSMGVGMIVGVIMGMIFMSMVVVMVVGVIMGMVMGVIMMMSHLSSRFPPKGDGSQGHKG